MRIESQAIAASSGLLRVMLLMVAGVRQGVDGPSVCREGRIVFPHKTFR